MSDDPRLAFARQLKQHLDALRAAGIEYVPRDRGSLPVAEVPKAAPAALARPVTAPPPPSMSPRAPTLLPPPVAATVAVEPVAVRTVEAPAPVVAAAPVGPRQELQLLAGRVAQCSRCAELFATRTQTVFGEGRIEPEVCFVGEAPGAEEDASGRPFVGRSGQLLDKIIVACGFARADVYICNVIKCRPPANRQPAPPECANCREYLDRQLQLVRPKYLVALGLVASQNLLASTISLTKLRGKLHDYRGTPLLCTFHPSALLRDESKKKDCWDDMKLLLKEMGRPVPGARG